jgi:hypothetical protein
MTPESKCVSLATAKALKEAGFPQDTERAWLEVENSKLIYRNQNGDVGVPAPDAQEIGELLPEVTDQGFLEFTKSLYEDGEEWEVFYCDISKDTEPVAGMPNVMKLRMDKTIVSPVFGHKNEAEARAACWLYLKQQKLI